MAESRLITELILKDNFTQKAKTATASSEGLTDSLTRLKQVSTQQLGGGSRGMLGVPMAGAGLLGMLRTPHILAGAGALGAFGLNSMIRNLSGAGGVISSILSFLPRFISSLLSLASLFSLLRGKIGFFIALGLQLARIPFEILGTALSFVGQVVEKVISVLGDLAEKLLSVAGTIIKAMAGIAMAGVNVSNEFDTLRRSMAGFLGSVAGGQQAARFLQAYGLQSPFEQQPIFEAARTLAALGLKFSKFLPVVEQLALFRGDDSANLREITELLMRLVGGQTALVFGPRGLGRMGFSRQMMIQAGAEFDNQGQFVGGLEKALEVFENLANLPMVKGVADMMRESNAVAFSNALDAINAVLVEIGDKLNAVIVPLIRKASEYIISLVRGGYIDKIFNMFSLKLGDGWNLLENVIRNIAAFLLGVPDIAKLVADTVPDLLVSAFERAFLEIQNAFVLLLHKIENFCIEFLNSIMGWTGFTKEKLPSPDFSKERDLLNNKLSESLDALTSGFDAVMEKNRQIIDDIARAGQGMRDIEDPTEMKLVSEVEELTEVSKKIEKNTSDMLDLRTHILGGGDIGRLGITPVEMRSATNRININVNAGDSELQRFLVPLIRSVISQYERQRRGLTS